MNFINSLFSGKSTDKPTGEPTVEPTGVETTSLSTVEPTGVESTGEPKAEGESKDESESDRGIKPLSFKVVDTDGLFQFGITQNSPTDIDRTPDNNNNMFESLIFINLDDKTFTFFKTKLNETPVLQMQKIDYILHIFSIFDVLPTSGCIIVSLDVPINNPVPKREYLSAYAEKKRSNIPVILNQNEIKLDEAFHKDRIITYILNGNDNTLRSALNINAYNGNVNPNYTFFEYIGDSCVSTTIEGGFRAHVCAGFILGVNNKKLKHSKPYIMNDSDKRSAMNKLLIEQSPNPRILLRSQLSILDSTQISNIKTYITSHSSDFYAPIHLEAIDWEHKTNKLHDPQINILTLDEYQTNINDYIYGGNKNKNKNNKMKTNKMKPNKKRNTKKRKSKTKKLRT